MASSSPAVAAIEIIGLARTDPPIFLSSKSSQLSIDCRPMSRRIAVESLSFHAKGAKTMDMETKFFSLPLTGEDHVTVIARGRIDVGGVKQIFLSVAEITQMLVGCGVLIDLRQGSYRLTYRDIYGLLNELKPALRRLHHRIALISAPTIEQSDQLFMLSVCLADQGLEADVFYDIPRAIEWLTHKRRAPVLN